MFLNLNKVFFLPGKAAGKAKSGIAMTKQTTAAAKNPIHHAPTHILL